MRFIFSWERSLFWSRVACQWWRVWEAQGGLRHSLRRLPLSRLAALAQERAEAASRLADVFGAMSAVSSRI